jgi:hypothetical protein
LHGRVIPRLPHRQIHFRPGRLFQSFVADVGDYAYGRVEDWRGVPKVWPSLLLPVSVGSASIAEP